MTRDEILATWLGWRGPGMHDEVNGYGQPRLRRNAGWIGPDGEFGTEPLDFLNDETANAMLRDKLLANGFSFYVRQDGTDVFRAGWLWQKFMVAPNTAIIQAALALIRSQA